MEPNQIVKHMRLATTEVFTTMLGIELSAGDERTELTAPAISDGVMAFVGLAGPWSGAGVISCSAGLACQVCNGLLMTEIGSVNEEVLDAVGEVANMVVGNFKTAAEEYLGPMGLSIPTVIYGRNFTSRSLGGSSWIVLPFRCGEETIEIRVCLTPSKEQTTQRGGYSHASALVA
jgi:chemotaxis protein CheX